MLLRRPTAVDWEEIRRRMLRETEEYLADGLLHPERAVRIPAHPVGDGRFPRAYARMFWERVLNLVE